MASIAPKVTSLDRERFDRLLAAEADALARLAAARANLDAFRKAYSTAHRFSTFLTVEQVKRDLEARS